MREDVQAAAPMTGMARKPAESGRGGHRGLALGLVLLAQLLVVIDVSIVTLALPAIQLAFHFSPVGLQWVLSGYALAFGGFLLLGGRLADLAGPAPDPAPLLAPIQPDLSRYAFKRRNNAGSRVLLSLTLAGPAPSGSTDTSRLCRGCSHPHRRFPDQAAPSFAALLGQGHERDSQGQGHAPRIALADGNHNLIGSPVDSRTRGVKTTLTSRDGGI